MAGIEVVHAAMDRFIEFPYRLHAADPHWVPPLRAAQRGLLDTAKHPFYRHAGMQLFLALDGSRVLGRVAAILDRNQDPAGFFGFFDAVDSQPAAAALLAGARLWLGERGAPSMRGPVCPSTNYECGVLVDGFDSSPCVMMPYNPPYYARLIEGAGLRKARDLYAYTVSAHSIEAQRAMRISARSMRDDRFAIRRLDMARFWSDVDAIWEIYRSAWNQNWGFAPLTRDEFRHLAGDFKPIVVPDLALIGEVRGNPVGFALAVPDMNVALKHAGGRLFPLGLARILYHKRRIRRFRVMALGVVEQYRTTGVAAAFYSTLIRRGMELGYNECECSWVLEDNILMNRSIASLGARRYKTYRLYEGGLSR